MDGHEEGKLQQCPGSLGGAVLTGLLRSACAKLPGKGWPFSTMEHIQILNFRDVPLRSEILSQECFCASGDLSIYETSPGTDMLRKTERLSVVSKDLRWPLLRVVEISGSWRV